jgi:hypothetical protein
VWFSELKSLFPQAKHCQACDSNREQSRPWGRFLLFLLFRWRRSLRENCWMLTIDVIEILFDWWKYPAKRSEKEKV